MQLRFSNKIRNAFKNAEILITPRIDVHNKIYRIYKKDTLIIPETGIIGNCIPVSNIQHSNKDGLNILWVGRFIYTKKLDIAIKTIAKLKHLPELKLHIVGFGLNQEERHYKDLTKRLGIEDRCIWYGRKDNKDVMELMKKMDLFFFTSIAEVTSTVVPEAIQNRLPIVCHNTCGFGNIVNDSIGRKIELRTPQDSINDFAKVLEELYNDKSILEKMKPNFDKVAEDLTYEAKAKKMFEIYNSLLKR